MGLLCRPVGRAVLQDVLENMSLALLSNLRIDSKTGALHWRGVDLPSKTRKVLAILPPPVRASGPRGSTRANCRRIVGKFQHGAAQMAITNREQLPISSGHNPQSSSSGDVCSVCGDEESSICSDQQSCTCGAHPDNSDSTCSEVSNDQLEALVAIAERPESGVVQTTMPSDAYLPWRRNSVWQPYIGTNSLISHKMLSRVCSSTNISRCRADLIFKNHNFGLPPRVPCPATSNCNTCILGRGRKIAYNFSAILKRKRHMLLQHRYDRLQKNATRTIIKQSTRTQQINKPATRTQQTVKRKFQR